MKPSASFPILDQGCGERTSVNRVDTEQLEDIHESDHLMVGGAQQILSVPADVVISIDNFVKVDVTTLGDGIIVRAKEFCCIDVILLDRPRGLRDMGRRLPGCGMILLEYLFLRVVFRADRFLAGLVTARSGPSRGNTHFC